MAKSTCVRWDPGFEVDLYVSTDLRTMTAIWMGLTTVRGTFEDHADRRAGNREPDAGVAWPKPICGGAEARIGVSASSFVTIPG